MLCQAVQDSCWANGSWFHRLSLSLSCPPSETRCHMPSYACNRTGQRRLESDLTSSSCSVESQLTFLCHVQLLMLIGSYKIGVEKLPRPKDTVAYWNGKCLLPRHICRHSIEVSFGDFLSLDGDMAGISIWNSPLHRLKLPIDVHLARDFSGNTLGLYVCPSRDPEGVCTHTPWLTPQSPPPPIFLWFIFI